MNDIVLKAENIEKVFTEGHKALDGISITVRKGDFVSILGASGSGKSTLLSILGGMETQTSGKVFFMGTELSGLKEKELAKLRRTQLGFVFQFFNLAPYLTVKENILLPLILDGKNPKKYEDKLNELTDYLKISAYVDKMPTKLSGGEQQRVAIARGLIYEPEIIFLDEPTGNLDSKNSVEIMQLLSQINKERHTTILQVTHSEKNALYGNRIIRIEDGKIIEESVRDDSGVWSSGEKPIERNDETEEIKDEGNVLSETTEDNKTENTQEEVAEETPVAETVDETIAEPVDRRVEQK